jgi:alkylation response protein AidB-like acyl-CoA dehydrogenase
VRNFFLAENQLLFRDSLARLIHAAWTQDKRRKVIESDLGYCPELWRKLADIGALSAFLPEAAGGMGGTGHDLMVIMEAIGRAGLPSPFLETAVIAASLLGDEGEGLATNLLVKIGSGEAIVAVALHEPQARYALSDVRTRAERSDRGFILTGEKHAVAFAQAADRIIVPARTSGEDAGESGITLFLVDHRDPGVHLELVASFDGIKTATLRLAAAELLPERMIGEVDHGFARLRRAVDLAILAQAAEAIGAMNYLLGSTLDYVKVRYQFGAAIGSNQAVQHRLVDMYTAVEMASALVQSTFAGITAPDDDIDPAGLAKLKLMTDRAARLVAQEAVQLHGGMGVSAETPVSHYFKRLTAISQSFADQFELHAIYRGALRSC